MAETSGNAASPSGGASLDSARAATGALVLSDGTVYFGEGLGAAGRAVGEVCFVTAMSGYQETLTDPSFAGQIVTFTFPHIGIVGANAEDMEASKSSARGTIMRMDTTDPSNFRAAERIDGWLKRMNVIGLAGLDTRRLTRRIRSGGAPTGVIVHAPDGTLDQASAISEAAAWPGLEGMDLAKEVTCQEPYLWNQTPWALGEGFGLQSSPERKIVAVDYGAKHNILRHLAGCGAAVEVVPATMTAEAILARKPDGVFLSNGPGDPAATGASATPILQALVRSGVPIFGICLGHQLLAQALGAKTAKMAIGHRGANQPVKDLVTGKVEITSQNHGFAVQPDSFGADVVESHVSLFDGSNEGLRVKDRPIFSVQYHPEASPGPHDSRHLFDRFMNVIDGNA
jgi:carbamoyl-phosphate synthase small subunit